MGERMDLHFAAPRQPPLAAAACAAPSTFEEDVADPCRNGHDLHDVTIQTDNIDDVFDEVVMHLQPREFGGLWIGFDCSAGESLCGDAVLVELRNGPLITYHRPRTCERNLDNRGNNKLVTAS